LILDDTTSAVDAGTEAEINAALGRYADDQHMLLVIARRRATLRLASRRQRLRLLVLHRWRCWPKIAAAAGARFEEIPVAGHQRAERRGW
jgi:ABC-type sugar transport system ATPase subunit